MIPLPHRDARAALIMDEMASALDAGLDLAAVFPGAVRPATQGDLPLEPARILAAEGVQVGPAEQAIFAAAETAGALPRALRERARARHLRADLLRQLLASLRYPLLLVAMAVLIGFLVASLGLPGAAPVLLAVAGPFLLLAVVALFHLARRSTSSVPLRVPVLGPVLQDLGELPYLETLRGLYAAGIPLLRAHPQAVDTIPIACLRASLVHADTWLQQGRPLAEALELAAALSAETRRLLTSGEAGGDLEGALERAATRRRETLTFRARTAAKLLGGTIYGLAVVLVAYLVLSFYGGLYGSILSR